MVHESGATQKDTQGSFEAFIKVVTGARIRDDTVTIPGFGTFASKHLPQREGRNPRTGESLTIAASNNPTFKAGKLFKDALN